MGACKLTAAPSFPLCFYGTHQPLKLPFPTYFKFSPGEVVNEPLTPPLTQVTGEEDYLSFITPVL